MLDGLVLASAFDKPAAEQTCPALAFAAAQDLIEDSIAFGLMGYSSLN